jgi:hypothetical protein
MEQRPRNNISAYHRFNQQKNIKRGRGDSGDDFDFEG